MGGFSNERRNARSKRRSIWSGFSSLDDDAMKSLDDLPKELFEEAHYSDGWVSRHPRFIYFLGLFNTGWATLEITTDFAICKFLKVTPLQAHLITGGMVFGRKARLLADLIGRSDDANKAEILDAFNALRNNNKRDVFSHGYIWSDSSRVKFIERPAGGESTVKIHEFTLQQFEDHVADFAVKLIRFYKALGCTSDEIMAFGDAAFSLDRKSSKPKTNPH